VSRPYLAQGLPAPRPARDGLDAPYWNGLQEETLLLQRCDACQRFQWGPEWICHRCHSFQLTYTPVATKGRVYSYERVWHPVHPALKDQGPYIVVLVELTQADNVRIVGNLLGDPQQAVPIGAAVQAVFEHHREADPAFTLLQWRLSE
jgi:uncharacterized OB-fold protein